MTKNYFDLYTTIKLDTNVNFKDLNYYLSSKINKILLNDAKLKNLHSKTSIKGYVFSSLHPLEKDKVYKEGKEYIFNIYVYNFDIALRLRDALKASEDIKEVNMRMKEFVQITELYSTSPCLTSLENAQYWTIKDSTAELYERIDSNAKHKAVELFGADESLISNSENFIESIDIRNKSDIILNYKKGKLFAYSALIKVKQDPVSQFLANICIANGIGEKNSLGFGFCINRKET